MKQGNEKKAAIYCRLSKEDEEKVLESESIQNQKAMLTEYAAGQGWEIYHIYCDEDYSGADASRPAFNRLIRDAALGLFGIVLVKTQSRFTRDLELVERYIHHDFVLWGIRFIAVVDHVDTEIKGGKKARQINGLINEWYLEDLSENIRMVLDAKRRAGQFIGSFAPYGYHKSRQEKGRLIIDPAAAGVVRKIFRHYLDGNGTRRIAELLNQQGIESPEAHRRNTASGGCGWSKTAVTRILNNEVYLGNLAQGKKKKLSYKSGKTITVPPENWIRTAGTHEPIIDSHTFESVRVMLQKRARSGKSGQLQRLAGLARCGECGKSMTVTSAVKKEVTHTYLRCRHCSGGTSDSEGGCSIRLDRLEQAIEASVEELIGSVLPLDGERIWRLCSSRKPDDSTEREIRNLQAELQRIGRAVAGIYLDQADGLLEPDISAPLLRDLTIRKKVLEQNLETLKETKIILEPEVDRQAFLNQMIKILREPSREFLCLLIDKIVIFRKNKCKNTQKIVIYWKI